MPTVIDLRENRAFATEMKFLIGMPRAEQIRAWARARLGPDPHAAGPANDVYRITSLYFDTEDFDVFHRRRSYGRSKFRIRRYGRDEVAFLERKLRTRRLLTKRRSVVRLTDLERLAGAEAISDWAGFWFHRRILKRRVTPVCRISYLRTARVAMTPYGPIRLTLDDQVTARRVEGIGFDDEPGTPLLENETVLEMKFRFAMPLLFKNLAEEFALNPQPFSKYRFAAAALGLVDAPAYDVQIGPMKQYA